MRPKSDFGKKVHYWCYFSGVKYRFEARDAVTMLTLYMGRLRETPMALSKTSCPWPVSMNP